MLLEAYTVVTSRGSAEGYLLYCVYVCSVILNVSSLLIPQTKPNVRTKTCSFHSTQCDELLEYYIADTTTGKLKTIFLSCVYRASYCSVLMISEMHNSYNQFLFHIFLSALHVSNESSCSSSWAQHSTLYYTVWYNRYNRAVSTIVPIVLCNTVYYAVLLMMNNWIRSKHVERTKNCGLKSDYKNCASR